MADVAPGRDGVGDDALRVDPKMAKEVRRRPCLAQVLDAKRPLGFIADRLVDVKPLLTDIVPVLEA